MSRFCVILKITDNILRSFHKNPHFIGLAKVNLDKREALWLVWFTEESNLVKAKQR